MKITKIRIKNALGIEELSLTPGQITELAGMKGTGKTSFLDALQMALSNRNVRTRFIRNGEETAELYVETDAGLVIDRKKQRNTSDAIKVLNNGTPVSSPETFLKTLFSDNQFNPLKFVELTPKEQKKVLLSLVQIDWSADDLRQWFGVVPADIDLEDHILDILDHLGSRNSSWYQTREEHNRDRRQKEAIRDDILSGLPDGYNAEQWRNVSLSELYTKVSKAQENNAAIDRLKAQTSGVEDRKKAIEGEYLAKENDLKQRHQNYVAERGQAIESIKHRIAMLEKEIEQHQAQITNADTVLTEKLAATQDLKQAELQKVDELAKASEQNLQSMTPISVEPLQHEAEYAEKMKSFVSEYDRAGSINVEIEDLKELAERLTMKIECARELPGILLHTASVPVEGLTVEDGEVLIKGLPVENLSSGEQLELAVEIAKAKAGELKVVFVDKLESLDSASREIFLEKCRQSGLQFFVTRVADTELEVRTFGEVE